MVDSVEGERAKRRGDGLSLVGYRGSGKTSVGQILAERLGKSFADSDRVIEKRLGMPISDFFKKEGEPAFRQVEEAVITELSGQHGLVLATGGGAVMREANRAALRAMGPVVWLKGDPRVLAERIAAEGAESRPALTSAGTLEEIEAVLKLREPIYGTLADITVETSRRSPLEVADAICNYLDQLTAATAGEPWN